MQQFLTCADSREGGFVAVVVGPVCGQAGVERVPEQRRQAGVRRASQRRHPRTLTPQLVQFTLAEITDAHVPHAGEGPVGVVGVNGSGKTTLLRCIAGLEPPDEGEVLIGGKVMNGIPPRERDISMVFQGFALFPLMRVRDNIAFGLPELTDAEIERVARLAQAHEFVEQLPDGYDTVIGERGITLSGGQRQRIAIARALAVDPRILILDDATASVDATTEARIRAGLREAVRDRTTLIIAHRLSTIALADEIVVLDQGKVVGRGTHATLVQNCPLYQQMWEAEQLLTAR